MLAATMPIGSVAYEAEVNERCERVIWLEPHVVDKLRRLRGARKSYSDVMIRLSTGVANSQ
jgi:hypothetical protein